MDDWKLKLGNFLFKHRSFTPIPLILLVFFTFKPLNLDEHNLTINIAGLALSLLGEFTRVLAVGFAAGGTSGRESFLKADSLNNTGIYSLVRNPLYIGNFLIFSGLAAVFANPLALLVFVFFLFIQYYFIILAEENYLQNQPFAAAYQAYCSRVRRFIPTFKNYHPNSLNFDMKKVVFKENDSLFNLLTLYLLVLLYKEKIFSGTITHPLAYILPASLLVSAYIVIKIIKKKRK